MQGECPRCGSDSIEVGKRNFKVGKSREEYVSVKKCPKCTLIFFERLERTRKVKSAVTGKEIPHYVKGKPYIGRRVEVLNLISGLKERGEIISGPNEQGLFVINLDTGKVIRKRLEEISFL